MIYSGPMARMRHLPDKRSIFVLCRSRCILNQVAAPFLHSRFGTDAFRVKASSFSERSKQFWHVRTAGVYDQTMTPSAIVERYSALMQHFAAKVWETTKELHHGCGESGVVFQAVPVNTPNSNYIVTLKESLKDGGSFYDFFIMPPSGVACMSSTYGTIPLLTRAKSRYSCPYFPHAAASMHSCLYMPHTQAFSLHAEACTGKIRPLDLFCVYASFSEQKTI